MDTWWREFFLSGDYTELERVPVEKTATQVEFVADKLRLRAGERLLDVACGIGRHSLPLARRGIRVTGLDFTPRFVRTAAADAEGLPAHFVRGDMRRIPFADCAFDAAVNLFTSFGYLESDQEDAAVLGEISRVLRPHGRFLIDTIHRDAIAHGFRERDWAEIPGGYLLQDRSWDSRTGRSPSMWVFLRDGGIRTHSVNVRLYTCPELERMLNLAGMAVQEVWGDWQGSPLSLATTRLIIAAEKRE